MYTLTLTHDERRAIDWIGNCYSNGNDLYKLLWVESILDQRAEEIDWASKCEMTFVIPEYVAWQIRDIGIENAHTEGQYCWPCFSPELCRKLNDFCDKIV